MTVLLDALWAWTGHVTDAAASIDMHRGHYYERLKGAGVDKASLKELRDTGRLVLHRTSGDQEYEPTSGTQRYVQPKNYVPSQNESPRSNLSDMSTATETAPNLRRVALRAWRPKPSELTTLNFERAVLELRAIGLVTDKDALLDALADSIHFQAFLHEQIGAHKKEGK